MAENENGQEKTEEPSEKRLREAREWGQVVRSRELGSLAIAAGSISWRLFKDTHHSRRMTQKPLPRWSQLCFSFSTTE